MVIHTFETLPSTNQYCELLDLSQIEEFAVYWAQAQTSGIGQRGNHWASEPNKNLTFSLILKPTFLPVADQFLLTKVVSLGITDCLRNILPKHADIRIKWPNDIYVGNSKICGILISHCITGGLLANTIVGIGLNVNQTSFPDWIPNPTSVKLLTHSELELLPLLTDLILNIQNRYTQLRDNPNSLDAEYLSQLMQLGVKAKYIYHEKEITATILGVNRFGHLQLITAEGETLSCQLKEIHLPPNIAQ